VVSLEAIRAVLSHFAFCRNLFVVSRLQFPAIFLSGKTEYADIAGLNTFVPRLENCLNRL
jgi:hypothetical protein